MKAKYIPGVPEQVKGSFHDTESTRITRKNEIHEVNFNILKQRFFAINNWKSYCEESSADFKLCDRQGYLIERLPKEGDYIRIDIPGPGGCEGRSFDWVEIIKIEHHPEKVMIVCRPSKDPVKESTEKIAHFYSDFGTSTFIISNEAGVLKAGIYGRNEFPNLKSGFFNSVRNIMIAIGGMFGFSKIQWKCLAEGLVDF